MEKLNLKLVNGPEWLWLQVWRNGDEEISWDELQRVKNHVFGPEAWAVEIYPAESELVSLRNVRHLWCPIVDTKFPNLKKILGSKILNREKEKEKHGPSDPGNEKVG